MPSNIAKVLNRGRVLKNPNFNLYYLFSKNSSLDISFFKKTRLSLIQKHQLKRRVKAILKQSRVPTNQLNLLIFIKDRAINFKFKNLKNQLLTALKQIRK
jgi:ribonuclease P protein component